MKHIKPEVEVSVSELSAWIQKNEPRSAEKLAVLSLVSMRTVGYLFNGIPPKLLRTRVQIARAMKRPVDAIFPVKSQKQRAG